MVVNRGDTKKRRKEVDAMDGSVDESPKRTKVHAQRKFAQGSSSLSSVALTPIKDKDKLKSNGSIPSSELIPLKRPKTEDFLTFLCFRGSSILPPQLNFFNVATFQEIPDEESSMSARDRSPNSSIDLTCVGQKLQKILEIEEISNVVNDDQKRDAFKRRATAVQAIRKKYQEQRLAKQRANTINKVAHEENGKTTISTRSSTMRVEELSLPVFQSKNSVSQKCSIKDNKIPKQVDSLNLVPLRKRSSVLRRSKYPDFRCSTVRRCGLRSSAVSPLRNVSVGNELDSSGRASKSILSENKTFLSSVSDFSSDDDQPLMKTKLTQKVHNKEFTEKVIKRITSRTNQIQTRILTRSRVQQQYGQQQLCQEQMCVSHDVGYRQQPEGQVRQHNLHYLYSHRRLENSAATLPEHGQLKRLPPLSLQEMVPQQITTRFSSRSARNGKESSSACMDVFRKQHDSRGNTSASLYLREAKKTDSKIVRSKDDKKNQNAPIEKHGQCVDYKRRSQSCRLYPTYELIHNVKQKKPVVLLNHPLNKSKNLQSSLLKKSEWNMSTIKASLRARTVVKECLNNNSESGKQGEDNLCKRKGNPLLSNDIDGVRVSKDKKSLRSREGSEYTSAKCSLRTNTKNRVGTELDVGHSSNESKEGNDVDKTSNTKMVSGTCHQLRSKRLQKRSNFMEVSKSKSPHRRSLRHNFVKILESSCVLPSNANSKPRGSNGKSSMWRDRTKNHEKLVSGTVDCKFSESDEEPLKKIAIKTGTSRKLTVNTQSKEDKKPFKNTLYSAKMTKTEQNLSKFQEKYKTIAKVTRANSSLVDYFPTECGRSTNISEQIKIKKKRVGCSGTFISKEPKNQVLRSVTRRENKSIEKSSKSFKCNDNVANASSCISEDISKRKQTLNKKLPITNKCPKGSGNISKSFVQKSFLRNMSGRKQVTERKIVNSSNTAESSPNCRRRKTYVDVPSKAGAVNSVQDKKSVYKLGKEISNCTERVNCKPSELFPSNEKVCSEFIGRNVRDGIVCGTFNAPQGNTETKLILSSESFVSQFSESNFEKAVLKEHLCDNNFEKVPNNTSKRQLREELSDIFENCPNNSKTGLNLYSSIEDRSCIVDLKPYGEDTLMKQSSNPVENKCGIKLNSIANLPNSQEINAANGIHVIFSHNTSPVANVGFVQNICTVNNVSPGANISSDISPTNDMPFPKDRFIRSVECCHNEMNAMSELKFSTCSGNNNPMLKSQFNFKDKQVEGYISDKYEWKLKNSDSIVDGVCKELVDDKMKTDNEVPVNTHVENNNTCIEIKTNCFDNSCERKSDKYLFEYFDSGCFAEHPSIDKVNVKRGHEKHYPGSDESSIEFAESRLAASAHLTKSGHTAVDEKKGNNSLNELKAVLIDIEKECITPNPVLPPDLGLQDFQVKEKLNMSAERVEKWLSESCSGNVSHKKDCTLFEKNICNCRYIFSDDDLCFPYGNDKLSVGDDSRECDDDVGVKSSFIYGDAQECDAYRKNNTGGSESRKLNSNKVIDKVENTSPSGDCSEARALQSKFKNNHTAEESVVNSCDHVPEDSGCIQYPFMQNGRTNFNSGTLATDFSNKTKDILLPSPSRELSVAGVTNSSLSGLIYSKTLPVCSEEVKETESPQEKTCFKQEKSFISSQVSPSKQNSSGKINIRAKKVSEASLHVTLPGRTKTTLERLSEKKSIFQNRRPFPLKIKERKDYTPSANAFSPENESSVYAFETESEVSPSTPFRRHTRDSRTSSSTTSKSEEDIVKFVDEDTSCTESNLHVMKCASPRKKYMSTRSSSNQSESKIVSFVSDGLTLCTRASTSIAVQVNLDCETYSDSSSHCIISNDNIVTEPLIQKSMECSTQTECAEEEENESEGQLFYIPIQNAPAPAEQLIQGVAVKLGTEGPTGPNQRVIMRAKFITKPPNISGGSSVSEEPIGLRATSGPEIQFSTVSRPQKPFSANLPCDATNVSGTCSKISTPINVDPKHSINTGCAKTSQLFSHSHENVDFEKVAKYSGTYISTDSVILNAKPTVVKHLKMKTYQSTATSYMSNSIPSIGSSKHSDEPKCSNDQESQPCKDNSGCAKRSCSKGKICKSSDTKYSFFPSNVSIFPSVNSPGQLVEAPVFYPSDKEFQDPLEYIDKIRPLAETFGLCRIVPPPNFKPECKVSDDMRFTAYNQYVHKMLHRWGPSAKEMLAIKKYLITQNIPFSHPPLIGGMEVDLPRLYQTVQSFGGLKRVIEKKRWHKVADTMKIPKSAQDRVAKLDDIYCKYLLPYETLSADERQKLIDNVEEMWQVRQTKSLSQDGLTSTDNQDDEIDITDEECIVKGRSMPLNAFYRIARNTMAMWFRLPEPSSSEVEQEFWNHVMSRTCHVCVHSGSIDSSGCGYGFPCSKNSPFARHPWNLKVLTNNSGSILRSMGPIMGVTVPTLHVGMLFSTCCWYRDPHGLPWIEYLHTGAKKIWYGIPDSFSYLFRSAMNDMIPRYCKSKTIWLPSDTAMVPPSLLVKHGVSLCHTVQEPGQFIVVFPRAFTSSICTGYLVSESVYFAQPRWLLRAEEVFKDIRDSCEPSVFSLERLLISIAVDPRSQVDVLKQVLPMILSIRDRELEQRKVLHNLGLKTSERLHLPEANVKRRRIRHAQEEEGDYECEICRANLFVSLVINSHEEGVYCLQHAIELLTKKRSHLKYCKLLYTYDQAELKELTNKLQDKIDLKSQKKSSQGRHNVSSQK